MSQNRKRTEATARTRTAGARSPAERLEPGRAPGRPRGLYEREPSQFFAGFVRVVSAVLTISLVGMLLVGGTAFTIFHQYESPGPLEAGRTIIIPKGEGRIAIAERLEREGIIANRWTFVGGHVLQSFAGRRNLELKAGEYEIKAHASMSDVLETLAEGKSILYKTTLPEGLTSEQIVERLKSEPNLSGEISAVPPEGSLLPNTYAYSKGASRKEILDRMQVDQQKTLAELWAQRPAELPLRSIEELVTFASIVEKETGRPDERDRVAAVFYNRLKKGMRLQSDPTIIYGIAGGQGSLGRSITRTDLDAKNPYNTYQINGLPPGPICNPGRSALEAALKPAQTDDLYFVADGSGGHAFSATLKEHNNAVQKWRGLEKEQAKARLDSSEPPADDPEAAPIPSSGEDAPAATAPAKATTARPKPSKAAAARGKSSDDSDDAGDAPADTAKIPLPVKKPKRK